MTQIDGTSLSALNTTLKQVTASIQSSEDQTGSASSRAAATTSTTADQVTISDEAKALQQADASQTTAATTEEGEAKPAGGSGGPAGAGGAAKSSSSASSAVVDATIERIQKQIGKLKEQIAAAQADTSEEGKEKLKALNNQLVQLSGALLEAQQQKTELEASAS